MDGTGRAHVGIAANMFCTQCGKVMRVAPQHVRITVACPHCGNQLEPWRVLGLSVTPAASPIPTEEYYKDYTGYSYRGKVVAGVLGILLGWVGAHRFYLGFHGIGVLQIVVTVLTGGAGGVWGFVEGILCLTGNMRDAEGLPLRD